MSRGEAARKNGALSKGPITPEGKAISSQNALKHGLCAAARACPPLMIPNVLFVNENEETYQAFLTAMMTKYRPADVEESAEVVIYCSAFWRRNRAIELESAAVNIKLAELVTAPGVSESARSKMAFDEAYSESKFVANLSLYETRLQRICEKTRASLHVMLERRLLSESESAAPIEPATAPAAAASPERTNEPVVAPPAAGQVPRNARCICGSGLKYKRCCGDVTKNPPASSPPTILAA